MKKVDVLSIDITDHCQRIFGKVVDYGYIYAKAYSEQDRSLFIKTYEESKLHDDSIQLAYESRIVVGLSNGRVLIFHNSEWLNIMLLADK